MRKGARGVFEISCEKKAANNCSLAAVGLRFSPFSCFTQRASLRTIRNLYSGD